MQSTLCRGALVPTASCLRLRLAGNTASLAHQRQQLYARRVLHSNNSKYPELEDILGKPAATFERLIDQLETLMKHPNPPRNYADALAKEELRRQDVRDLTPETSRKYVDPDRKMLLRQRPRMLRHAQPVDSRDDTGELETKGAGNRQQASAGDIDAASDLNHLLGVGNDVKGPGTPEAQALPEDVAINLGITSEQQKRRRIWLTKVAGYKAFRNKLLSLDTLLDSLEDKRTSGEEASRDQEPDGNTKAERPDVAGIEDEPFLEDDREFERLIRKSWRLRDEDIDPVIEQGPDSASRQPSNSDSLRRSKWPSGKRSYHAGRIVSDTAKPRALPNTNGSFASFSRPRAMSKNARFAKGPSQAYKDGADRKVNKKILLSKAVSQTQRLPRSLIKNADLPTARELKKHISESKENAGEIHVPIEASVNTGDIVELRQAGNSSVSSQFAASIMTGGVIQKTTGRFHINSVLPNGSIIGSREQRIGFVAKGMLFNKSLLRSSGVDETDIASILEYAEELREYEATHGRHALVSAHEAALLQQLQNQTQTQGWFRSDIGESAEESSVDFQDINTQTHQLLSAVDSDMVPMVSKEAPETHGSPKDKNQGDAEHTITEIMMRSIPRVLRVFQQRAEQLMRSHYRELGEYWNMALSRGQKRVTVDALAELIFGDGNGEPVSEEARYAAYMHLISDPLHFSPDADGLFVTNAFELRNARDVREIESVRDLIRESAPEFRQFIEKAKTLVAYSHDVNPASPLRVALDPDLGSAKQSAACRLSGWSFDLETIERRPQPEQLPTSRDIARLQFEKSDFAFINVLRNYVFHHNAGYRHFVNPYDSLVSPIIKKMHYYSGCDVVNVTRFLVDLGVWPHWFNPKLNARHLPFGTLGTNKDFYTLRNAANSSAALYLGPEVKGNKAKAADPNIDDMESSDISCAAERSVADPKSDGSVKDAASSEQPLPSRFIQASRDITPEVRSSIITRSSTGVGIIDKTEYYGRDICDDIRHDFGDLPVYTIDDSATRDVDDGMSVETIRGADGKDQVWLHVHIADPTALVHPGHIAANAAAQQMATLYYAEKTQHMLPFNLTLNKFSLVRRDGSEPVRTMTFSVLIGDDGDIADYKVRPGIVRNITAVPYGAADKCLSFEWAPDQLNSLEKIRDAHRHATIIHPFATENAGIEQYGDMYDTPPDEIARQLRTIQEITRRHYMLRVGWGGFTRMTSGRAISLLDSQLPEPGFNISRPKFALPPFTKPRFGPLQYPGIKSSFGLSETTPAHMMVAELMIICGRVGTRFASEHGPSSGLASSGYTGVPLLYRVQEPPNLDALSGAALGMPLAFDELSAEEAKSARAVWDAMLARAKRNDGIIETKAYDEVRHMLNPSLFTCKPSAHTIMGITDKYGYARVTSPIRRFDDMVAHWQFKAQLLAEHGSARDKTPWYWSHEDMELLAPIVFRRNLLADQCMTLNEDYWSLTLMRRMEHEARRGTLQPPPEGFYNPDSPLYYDLPWPYYDPRNPGPLTWTATVDNRDESRTFISLIIDAVGARAMLIPRPVDATALPFAGTKLRVHVIGVDPAEGMLIVKLAPEAHQPPETPKFWRNPPAMNMLLEKFPITRNPPENVPVEKANMEL
ncbi:3'-5' RNA exonuclease complex component [Dipsacomyces acuminosporus]|nr:3'-5' RNA exonuclease complex component [Dipsacomyces acuminosporus]